MEKDDGTISAETNPTPLRNKPIGWQDLELSFDTVDKYFSDVKALSVPLQYVLDGAKILRHLLYNGKGYEEEVYCVILKLNSETGVRELEYTARIDMSKAVDDPEIGVTVNAKEGGFQSDLDAYEDVSYEFPLDGTNKDAINVLFDGIDLYDKFSYESFELTIDVTTAHYSSVNVHSIQQPYVIVPLVFLSSEGDNVGMASGDQSFEAFNSPTTLNTSANTILENFGEDKQVTIEGEYKFGLGTDYAFANAPAQFNAFLYIKSPSGLTAIDLATFNVVYGGVYSVGVNQTITLPRDGKVFLVFRFPTEITYLGVPSGGRDTMYKVTFFDKQKFKATFISRNDNSQAFAYQPLTIANLLVKKWNTKYSVQSNWLTNHNNIVATSGQALRNLPKPVLKYSFKDFWEDYNTQYCLCMNIIGNVMYIEKREQRFSSNTNNIIFDLGYLSKFTLTAIDKNIINTIKIGWPDQTYDQRNGKYEFNSTIEEKAPVTKKAELNLVSKSRGDSYGIEFIRGQLNNKSTTDNKGDTETFLVNIIPDTQQTATFNIDWTLTTKTLKLMGQAGLIGSFPVGKVFETVSPLAPSFNYFVFTVVSATPNGPDLDIVVAENAPSSIAFFPGYILFPSKLKRVRYDDIIGVPVPVVDGVKRSDLAGAPYNIEEMTPQRRLRYWGPWLKSVMFQLQSDKVTFQTATKNADLKTTLAGLTIYEKSDTQISRFDAPFFLNYYGKFTVQVPLTFSSTLANLNNAGLVKGIVNGFTLYFLPVGKMSSRPATNDAQEWQLTLAANNNLETLYLLSQEGIYISDGMNNTLTISILNPVHYVYYNKTLNVRYKYKDLFDDWVHHRNDQFAVQPAYTQKWEFTDSIKQQFITVGLSQIDLYLYDCDANEVDVVQSYVVSNPAVRAPYTLLQLDLDPSTYDEGLYVYVLKSGSEILLISEWQKFAEKHEGTYAIDYYNSYNNLNSYWAQYRPMIRVEAMWGAERFDGSTTDYKDETRYQVLDFDTDSSRTLRVGDPYGIPEWMQGKLNSILRLNRTDIEGTRITATADSKWEIDEPNGYPLRFCSIDLRRSSKVLGVSVTGTGDQTETAIIWNVDAEAFGQAPGVIQIEVKGD